MSTETGALAALGHEKYVRLTTFRRDGTPVATPVWVVPDEADPAVLWVMTSASTGKVKRLRHTPRVVLAACSARGAVAPGAQEVTAVGAVLTDAATARAVQHRVTGRYGLLGRVTQVSFDARAALRRIRGRAPDPPVAVRLSAT
jgi:PPOX class probable F420-dependent enzyme